jgi:hypothetical protein
VAKSQVWCEWCNSRVWKENGAIKRARSAGLGLYCNRACSGLGRRGTEHDPDDLRERKAAYDRRRRVELADRIRAEKAEYYRLNHDREKERQYRKANMARHVEYCRSPAYREKKKAYDRKHLAEKHFGPFADAALLVRDLEAAIAEHADRYEIYRQNGTLNKSLQRKRAL